MGSLIDESDCLRCSGLNWRGTRTGGRSLISKAETEVETLRLWEVCSITISQYLKMRWAKLNTHTEGCGNLGACSRFINGNGWHKINGACRCRRCYPRPVYFTQRRFLGLGIILINALALHIDDQGQREKISRLHNKLVTVCLAETPSIDSQRLGIFRIRRDSGSMIKLCVLVAQRADYAKLMWDL